MVDLPGGGGGSLPVLRGGGGWPFTVLGGGGGALLLGGGGGYNRSRRVSCSRSVIRSGVSIIMMSLGFPRRRGTTVVNHGYLHSSVKMAIALGYCVVCRFDDETRWAAE